MNDALRRSELRGAREATTPTKHQLENRSAGTGAAFGDVTNTSRASDVCACTGTGEQVRTRAREDAKQVGESEWGRGKKEGADTKKAQHHSTNRDTPTCTHYYLPTQGCPSTHHLQ